MTTRIVRVSGRELYHRYPTQSGPQDCYVELDCESGQLSASYDAEIGGGVPSDVWHGHRLRWGIPALTEEAANALLTRIAPLAAIVCEGYESRWDGNNRVADFTAAASAACEEIDALSRRDWDDDECLSCWDAGDWLAGIGSLAAQCRSVGITATTTDAELEAVGEQLTLEAEADGVALERLDRHLVILRDHARGEGL